MENDKEFEDLMRFHALIILEQEELSNKGKLLMEVKGGFFNDCYLQIYEKAIAGRCAFAEPYPMKNSRDFEYGFSRVFMCGQERGELRLYVDQGVNQDLYSEIFRSEHPYYNVYVLKGHKFAAIYDFLRDHMHKVRKD